MNKKMFQTVVYSTTILMVLGSSLFIVKNVNEVNNNQHITPITYSHSQEEDSTKTIPNSPGWHHMEEKSRSDDFVDAGEDKYFGSKSTYKSWFDSESSTSTKSGSENLNHTFKIKVESYENNIPNGSLTEYKVEKIRLNKLSAYSDSARIQWTESGWNGKSYDDRRKQEEYLLLDDGTNSADDFVIINQTSEHFYLEEESGMYILEPTYDTTDANNKDVVHEEMLTVTNNYFREDWGETDADPVLSYSWDANSDIIEFEFTNVLDYEKPFSWEGHYHFMTFLEMDYDEYVVRDEHGEYDLSNDTFGLDDDDTANRDLYLQTQENFNNLGMESGIREGNTPLDKLPKYTEAYKAHRPYLTSKDSFGDLEKIILQNNLIESEDDVSLYTNGFSIEFYEENLTKIEDNSRNLYSSDVYFKIKNEGVKGQTVEGETPIMHYEIPFYDMSFYKDVPEEGGLITTDTKNLYDYSSWLGENDEDYTDNITTFNWSYDYVNDQWNLKTNVPFIYDSLEGTNINNVSWWGVSDSSMRGNIDLDGTEPLRIETKAIYKSETNNMVTDVRLKDNSSDEVFNFRYSYEGESNFDGVSITSTQEDTINGGYLPASIVKDYNNEMLALDSNGANISDSDKILKGYVVDAPVRIETIEINDMGEEYKTAFFEDKEVMSEDGQISREFVAQPEIEDGIIDTPGTYGVSNYDEYGNNSFTVIEYVDSRSKTKEQNSILYSSSKNHSNDFDIFGYQDFATNELFETYSSSEIRYLEEYASSDKMMDLNEIEPETDFNNEKLKLATNAFEEGVAFGEVQKTGIKGIEETSMRSALEASIELSMTGLGYDEDQYEIVWTNVNDNTLIYNDVPIKFEIRPSGYWETKGICTWTIEPATYTSLKDFEADVNSIEYITSNYYEGISKDDIYDAPSSTMNDDKTSLGDKIEAEILYQLEDSGIDHDLLWMYDTGLAKEVPMFDFKYVLKKDPSNDKAGIIEYDDIIDIHVFPYAPSNEVNLIKDDFWVYNIHSKTRIDLSGLDIENIGEEDSSVSTTLTEQLEQTTRNYFTGTQFYQIRDELNKKIIFALGEEGVGPSEVDITYNRTDHWTVRPGESVEFTITPNTSKYANEYTGTFIADPFTSLDNLNFSNRPLMQITNEFSSGTYFRDVEKELDKYIYDNLEERGIDPTWINIEWNLNDKDIVTYNTEISYIISSANEDEIKGNFESEFKAWNFYNLDAFMVDIEPLNAIVEPYLEEGSVMFLEIKEPLTQEVERQLNEQGYFTHITNDEGEEVKILDITWNRGDGEKISLGQSITFNVTSQNNLVQEFILKGEVTNNKIQFGTKVEGAGHISPQTFVIILIILMFVAIILSLLVIIKNKFKQKGRY